MGIFGWDLPPGVGPGDLPGEQEQAVDLLPYVASRIYSEAWWLEDGTIRAQIATDALFRGRVMSFHDWDDALTDDENFKAAAEVLDSYYVEGVPKCQS